MSDGFTRNNEIVVCDAMDYLRGFADGSVDCVVTSPPYDNLREYNGFTWDFEGIAKEVYRVLKDGGVMVWVVGDASVNGSETLTSFRQALHFVDVVGFRMHDTMIYQKDGAPFPESVRYAQEFEYMFVLSKGAPSTHNLLTMPTKYGASATNSSRSADGSVSKFKYATNRPIRILPNIWYMTSGYMKTTKDVYAYDHPAMFPEELAKRHILTWTNQGDLIVDFFAGSGTTLKMARLLGRRYAGCDLSADYVNIARRRLAEPFTPDMFQDAPLDEPKATQGDMFGAWDSV